MTTTHAPHPPTASDTAGREFWRGVLLSGGITTIPRWTTNPVAGVGEHEVRLPEESMLALRALATAMNVQLSSVFLAAHIRVLSALSGEHDVCTGYARQSGSPLPFRISTEGHSWRDLLRETVRAISVHNLFEYGEPDAVQGQGPYWMVRVKAAALRIAAAAKAGFAQYIGDGGALWSTVHVFDLADLYLAILNSEKAHGIFNAASDELLSRKPFETSDQARREVAGFIAAYNHRRPTAAPRCSRRVAFEHVLAERAEADRNERAA